ncbi:MAG: DUF2155 domain-containing protein [Alphaproteobacteria bacterium]
MAWHRSLLLGAAALIACIDTTAYAQSVAATLRVLDKVTARANTVDAVIGQPVSFGTLRIVVRSCKKNPPEETPESAAFLEIDDVRSGRPVKHLFKGWMFASSPGLHALEHPIYDVWVIDCKTVSGSGSSPKQ